MSCLAFLKRTSHKHLWKYAFPGLIVFAALGHRLINFWESPLSWMLLEFLFLFPLLTLLTACLVRALSPHLALISGKKLLLFSLAALLVGSFVAWRTYRSPEVLHEVTVAPLSRQVGLLEIKGGGEVISLQDTALKSGWQQDGYAFFAAPGSAPISVSFRSAVNQPVTVLFLTLPDGGAVEVSVNAQSGRAELSDATPGQAALRFATDYKGVPGWLFTGLLAFADIFMFSGAGFILLLIQHIGQGRIASQLVASPPHRRNLAILILLGLGLHIFNSLSTPLMLNADTPSFIQGSLHWLEYGNLDGVSMFRGPGTTFLFAPVMFLFGENAWGIKILLHLFAFGCIPLSYRLGWQISKNHHAAFLSGLLAAFSPDLLLYANLVMSDALNIFIMLVFLTLFLSALERPGLGWVLSAMLAGSFAVLLRSENLVMLIVGALFLVVGFIFQWATTRMFDVRRFAGIALAILLAVLPVLWWSAHNHRLHGFFGLSNYQGEVFYDGWVYYGNAMGLPFSDDNSPAIKAMSAATEEHPIVVTDRTGVPTGWEIYPALLAAGYTSQESFDLMESAAWDSILKNPEMVVQILFNKYEKGLVSVIPYMHTYPLPGEPAYDEVLRDEYFYQKNIGIAPLVSLQRQVNDFVRGNYPRLYPSWTLTVILAVFLSFLRSPWLAWAALTVITASRIFIPLTIGVAFWRYTLAGWLPAQIIAVAWLWAIFSGLLQVFRQIGDER
jgi:4-amino-4-deoxy-L-arabinose transferase-like glycosyltransferase